VHPDVQRHRHAGRQADPQADLVAGAEQAPLPVEKVPGPFQRHRCQLRVPEHARDRAPVGFEANAGAEDRHREIVAGEPTD
jgi:hypothetical protein